MFFKILYYLQVIQNTHLEITYNKTLNLKIVKSKNSFMADSSREQSEFNMAVSYLNRLNVLFYITDEAAMQLDVNTWMHGLMALLRELSTEMKPEEISDLQTKFKAVNEKIQSYNQEQKGKGDASIPSELYDELHNAEIELRKVLKESGLLMKMKEDAGKALK